MGRCLRVLGMGLVLVSLVSCRPGGRELAEIGEVLDRCDDPAACGAAWARLTAMDPERRDADSGVAVRLKSLRAGIESVAEFPEPHPAFLAAAGLDMPGLIAALAAEVRALSSHAVAQDAERVLALLQEPSCANAEALDTIEAGDGPMARAARLARLSVLAQLVSAVDAQRSEVFASAARLQIGCRLSDRAQPAVVLVEARNAFYDRVAACPETPTTGPMGRSCEVARAVAREKSLPLPLPDVTSGDFAGAVLPSGHGTGLRLTPPWVFVLSAGRLSVLDQKVLPPGERAAGEMPIAELLDLRRPHRIDDLRLVVAETLKTRRPLAVREAVDVIALAVDQSAVFSDLAEILEAIVAETDAHPVVGVLPPGYRNPMWLPLNYRMSFRPLLDPLGQVRVFAKAEPALDLAMTPFSLSLRGAGQPQVAEFGRGGELEGMRRADLRAAYSLVAGHLDEGTDDASAHLSVAAAVPAGLLFPMLDVLANRFSPHALSGAAAFLNARTRLGRGGQPEMMVPLIVIRPEGVPPQ